MAGGGYPIGATPNIHFSAGSSPFYLLEGQRVPVLIVRSTRARKMRLKIRYPKRVEIVLPGRMSLSRALEFAEAEKSWVAAQLSKLPDPVGFAPGNRIPLRGLDHDIRHEEGVRGLIRVEDGVIYARGAAEHIPRRIRDWLQQQARRDIVDTSEKWASQMGVAPGRITLRDQRTRWGSCSSRGSLNFSWRLILMPPQVLEYVVIHELAHLRHMHHGPAFWELVAEHMPDFHLHKIWLKENGGKFQKYDATI